MQILCFIPDIQYKKIIPYYNNRWEEKYLFLMHSILYNQIRNKKEFNGYVNLDSTLLKKYIGDKYYKFILNQLTTAKIVQPYFNSKGVQSYSMGAFSKAYRINPEILKSNRIKAVPITKKTYVRKISNVRSAMIKEACKINANIQHELLMLTYRRINENEAIEYIKTNYVEFTPQYNARMIAVREFNEMHKANFNTGKELLNFHFSYNKGRVYSPASMLPRDLEQFTYFTGYENEASICLDMPNSQLCFFDELITREKHYLKPIEVRDTGVNKENKMHHIGNRDSKEGIEVEFSPNFPQNLHESLSLIPPSIPPSLCGALFSTQNTWKAFIRKGLGYERMMFLSKWKNKESNHTKEERQEFKEIFFGQLFYNRYIPNYLTPLEQAFHEHHTSEAIALREIKKRLGNKLLAVQVQTLEGKFFHDICVHYLKKNYKDIPFTIKHDSITLPLSCGAFLVEELNELVIQFFNDKTMKFKYEQL